MGEGQNTEVIYPITIGDLQDFTIERIGRKLNDDELHIAKKCVEYGMSSIIDITLGAAVEQATEKNY